MVCSGRAVAHAWALAPRFSDPTALSLLPDNVRADIERFVGGVKARGLRQKLVFAFMHKQARLMAARTVAVDDSVREALATQVVILGAGLDGRAWRMPELAGTTVFEIDHPDSQSMKRARVASLPQTAGEVRFVPVDFTRDSVDASLAAAGHDASRPTTWIWEGVVMYLTHEQIEATLTLIGQRSAPKSRLIVVYHTPSLWHLIIGRVVRRMGEPLRSTQTPDQMRALLERHGFRVQRDENIAAIGARLEPELGRALRGMSQMSVVTADRRSGGEGAG
jgi:methyltransferase (TIGR00027 family)